MEMSDTLALMVQAARKAGESLVHDFSKRDHLDIVTKNTGDFVSQADERSERIITDILRAATPDWGVLGEENDEIVGASADHRWIVDPLDGTTLFLHGVPHWSITIAKQEKDEIVAGLIFDPMMNEMFVAEKGKGAFLNGQKLSVSSRQDLHGGLVSMNAGYLTFDPKTQDHHALLWKDMIAHGATVNSHGGLALQLAYVAAGRYEGCFCWKSKPWDWCAGALMVKEAGGVATDFSHNAVTLAQGEIVAANAAVYRNLMKLTGMN